MTFYLRHSPPLPQKKRQPAGLVWTDLAKIIRTKNRFPPAQEAISPASGSGALSSHFDSPANNSLAAAKMKENMGAHSRAFALEGARKKYPFRNACFMKTNQSAQNKNPKNKPAGKGCHVLRICEVGFYRQNANPVKNDGAHRAFFARPQPVRLRLPRFPFPAIGFLAQRARFHKKSARRLPPRERYKFRRPKRLPIFPFFRAPYFYSAAAKKDGNLN